MKHFYLILLVLLLSYRRVSSQTRYDACYSYGLNIFVYSQADKREDTLDIIGGDPDLSPDGTKVAYTKLEHGGAIRRIECVDLKSGTTTFLNNCEHCFGPVWSPDGNHIVFNDFDGNEWYILLLDLNGNAAPVDHPRALITRGGFYAPTWSDDGKKLLVHTLDDLFIVGLDGTILDSMPITRLRKDPSHSSGTRYLLSRDETRIIFDMELDAQAVDDSPSAIYVYDRRTKTTRKVSPEGYYCFQPVLKGDRIFFCGWKVGDPAVEEKQTSVGNIYSSAMDGSDFRLEFKNRRDFSYRR